MKSSRRSTESDTRPIPSPTEKGSDKSSGGRSIQPLKANAKPEEVKEYLSNVFSSKHAPFFANATVTTQAPPVDWDNFEKMFQAPAIYVPADKAVPTKYTKSSYNFINSTIGNAAIGNTGPVTFNKKQEVFKEGAKKTEVNISGGDFAQANIAGKATFNNKGSTVGAGSGGAGTTLSPGFVDIAKAPHPFSPEEYLAKLLQTGVTAHELTALLEKKYSIVDLSYSLPASNEKRAVLVETLLKVADMD